ncbi:hypothetical protein E2C01_020640 [Portunus trituberculatus]|uniref:Uncharacterized protein n=1 Tax=Portunus trituberculatus TaxID=210409 RepID=A0A5B7E0P7_PORTR|nr:hypothetical protein [Portunus trituberculatus]
MGTEALWCFAIDTEDCGSERPFGTLRHRRQRVRSSVARQSTSSLAAGRACGDRPAPSINITVPPTPLPPSPTAVACFHPYALSLTPNPATAHPLLTPRLALGHPTTYAWHHSS